MTERKPPGESWGSFVERQIRSAQEEGGFDDLSGNGKPIPGLTGAYDPLWWVKQLIEREKVALLPPSLKIRATVEKELAAIRQLSHEGEVRARLAALNDEIGRVNRTVTSGPTTTVAPVDVDEFVRRWRGPA